MRFCENCSLLLLKNFTTFNVDFIGEHVVFAYDWETTPLLTDPDAEVGPRLAFDRKHS